MFTKLKEDNIINELKKLKRIIGAFSLKVLGTVFSFLTSIIISRNFSTEGVGIYSLSNSILTICMIFSKLGFDIALIKYLSIDFSNKKYGDLSKKLKTIIIISMAIALVLSIIIALSAKGISKVFNKDNLEVLLRIMIWAIIPCTIIELIAAAFKAIKHTQIGLFFESVSVNAMRCIFLILIVVVFKVNEIEWVGYSYIIAACIVVILVYLIWKKIWKKHTKNSDYSVSDNYRFKPILSTAFPLLLVNSTNYILSSTDILMIGYWLPASEVGIYNIAIKITMFSSMLLSAINAILGPNFAVLYKNNDMEKLKSLVKKSSRLMFLCAIVILVFLGILAKPILLIWGEKFVVGVDVLYVSLVGQFFVLATGPLATLLMMCGFEKQHRNNTIICAVLNIVLNYFLIQKLGIVGAALASTISLAFKNLYCVYIVKRKLGFFCY